MPFQPVEWQKKTLTLLVMEFIKKFKTMGKGHCYWRMIGRKDTCNKVVDTACASISGGYRCGL